MEMQTSIALQEELLDDSRQRLSSAPSNFGRTPSKSPTKKRSLSDSTPPQLSPSPKIKERPPQSKDDSIIPSYPKTPKRPDFLARGLSLQMPPRETVPSPTFKKAPLSPQLDTHSTYGSPARVLPRHSRGMDFSRACTNLHHSTLAEQSSPDSSPTITQRGIFIPQRKGGITPLGLETGAWPNINHHDAMSMSTSVGSVSMAEADYTDSSSGDEQPVEFDEPEDSMMMTPQVLKLSNPNTMTPFATHSVFSPGNGHSGNSSPVQPNFMNLHRARLRDDNKRSRKSSSSASGHSSVASPVPASPPQKRRESNNGDYFAREAVMREARSRRESLSLGTMQLHISTGNDSGEEGLIAPATPGVVRRPVVRRGNLLPKSKQFNRIRGDLFEESRPLDTEIKQEAEIVRQVRESEPETQASTTQSSPSLVPTTSGLSESLEEVAEDGSMELDNSANSGMKGLFGAFGRHASRNSGGVEFWNNFDNQTRQTPPPPSFPRGSSSVMSDDTNMDSPSMTTPNANNIGTNGNEHSHSNSVDWSRASTPQPPAIPSAVDGLRKANKRRRDDDFDVSSIKRRAVSPSMQGSPVLSQSPAQRDANLWGQTKTSREGSVVNGNGAGERANSHGSQSAPTPSLGPKRIGLQGMTDTNDGLMKMSIE